MGLTLACLIRAFFSALGSFRKWEYFSSLPNITKIITSNNSRVIPGFSLPSEYNVSFVPLLKCLHLLLCFFELLPLHVVDIWAVGGVGGEGVCLSAHLVEDHMPEVDSLVSECDILCPVPTHLLDLFHSLAVGGSVRVGRERFHKCGGDLVNVALEVVGWLVVGGVGFGLVVGRERVDRLKVQLQH